MQIYFILKILVALGVALAGRQCALLPTLPSLFALAIIFIIVLGEGILWHFMRYILTLCLDLPGPWSSYFFFPGQLATGTRCHAQILVLKFLIPSSWDYWYESSCPAYIK
jgi:hypothetical protein